MKNLHPASMSENGRFLAVPMFVAASIGTASAVMAQTDDDGPKASAAAARDIFATLDSDGSGEISPNEAQSSFVVLKMFDHLDKDDDELLVYEEFDRLRLTHMISNDGETVIPKARDAKPEEAWTGGKTHSEAAAQRAADAIDDKTAEAQ